MDYTDEDSSNKFHYSLGDNSLSFARMQALTPQLSMGGLGRYNLNKKLFSNMFGALYEDESNIVGVQWDTTVSLNYI